MRRIATDGRIIAALAVFVTVDPLRTKWPSKSGRPDPEADIAGAAGDGEAARSRSTGVRVRCSTGQPFVPAPCDFDEVLLGAPPQMRLGNTR